MNREELFRAVSIVNGNPRWQQSPGWGDCAKAEREGRDAIEACILKIHGRHPDLSYTAIAERLSTEIGRMREWAYRDYVREKPGPIDDLKWGATVEKAH